MAHSMENWQAVRLSKPMTVNVTCFPEANIVAKEGEKIAVKITEGSIVYVAIMGPKAGQTFVPVIPQQHPAASQPAAQPPKTGYQQHPNAGQKLGKKPQGTYKPKATQPNAAAGTNNNASAASNGGAVAGDGKSRKGPNPNSTRNRTPKNNKPAVPEEKVITVEDLKRQRQEQAKHEAWLAQRRDLEKKEREEQDRRYKERMERAKKLKEEEEAKKEKEKEDKRAAGQAEEEQEKEGEKESSGPKSCWICSSDKHISRKCNSRCRRSSCNTERGPHSIQNCKECCLLCKGKGHDEWYCEKRCPVCRRGVGDPHLLENCPVECRLCGAKGHRDRDCEYSYGNRNRKEATTAH